MATKVLLVEDEVSLRELYEEVLKDGGYEVDTAGDGDTALIKIKEGKWNILLLDIMLPRLDGLELLSRIKKDDSINKKPILVISNLDNSDIMKQCLNLGVNEYVVKSNVTPQDLIEVVSKYS